MPQTIFFQVDPQMYAGFHMFSSYVLVHFEKFVLTGHAMITVRVFVCKGEFRKLV